MKDMLFTGIDGQDIEYVSTDSEAGSDSVASADEASLGRPRPKMVKLNAGPYPKGVKTSAAKPVDSRASSTAPYTTGRKKFVPDTRPKKTVASSGSKKNWYPINVKYEGFRPRVEDTFRSLGSSE